MLEGVATQASMSIAAAVDAPTLADLLALPALVDARVVPNDADLTVTVRAVEPFASGAECTPDALLIAAEGAHPVPAGATAVLARTAPSAEPDVPVIVLAESATWSAVLAAVSEAVTAGVRARADAARAALRIPLLAGDGYGALAQVASELLGDPVAILDPYLDTVGTAGLDEAMTAVLDRALEMPRAGDPSAAVAQFVGAKLSGIVREVVPGPVGPVGVVVMVRATALSAAERGALSEVVEACALEHARDEARVETEARLRGELVEELIAGEVVSRDSIVRRARLLGADLSNGAVAMIGTLQDPQAAERGSVDPLLERRFLSQVRAVIDLHWPRALVDWSAGRLLVLLPTPPEVAGDEAGVDERAHGLARRLLAATKETVPGLAVTLALSRHTAEPEKLGAALDEAELALSIGERLGRHGDVVTFEETGTYKLLFQIFADRPEELSSFYEQTLSALVKYDEQYQTELVATLATYLELDGNLAATAATLYTHRHTVRYRLDRIAELCGLDVGKSDDREKLSLGLKAMRLLGRPVRTGPVEKAPGRGRG